MASGHSSCSISIQKEAVFKVISAVIAAGKSVPEPNTFIFITEHANSRAFDNFCIQLYSAIQGWFLYVGKVCIQLAHERALTKFHCSRIENLLIIWKCLFRKSSWLEQYKMTTSKSTAKRKSLRKDIAKM